MLEGLVVSVAVGVCILERLQTERNGQQEDRKTTTVS